MSNPGFEELTLGLRQCPKYLEKIKKPDTEPSLQRAKKSPISPYHI